MTRDRDTDDLEWRRLRREVTPLPREFAYDLSTVERARQWLTNPHNWHRSELYILKWDGLVPTITRRHGMRLVRETWDDGLPQVVVAEQRERRARRDSGGEMDEREVADDAVER